MLNHVFANVSFKEAVILAMVGLTALCTALLHFRSKERATGGLSPQAIAAASATHCRLTPDAPPRGRRPRVPGGHGAGRLPPADEPPSCDKEGCGEREGSCERTTSGRG